MKDFISDHCNNSHDKVHSHNYSHSGKIPLKYRIKHLWHKIESSFFFVALASLFWLIYESGTKPSRIVYPLPESAARTLSTLVTVAVRCTLFLSNKTRCNFYSCTGSHRPCTE